MLKLMQVLDQVRKNKGIKKSQLCKLLFISVSTYNEYLFKGLCPLSRLDRICEHIEIACDGYIQQLWRKTEIYNALEDKFSDELSPAFLENLATLINFNKVVDVKELNTFVTICTLDNMAVPSQDIRNAMEDARREHERR